MFVIAHAGGEIAKRSGRAATWGILLALPCGLAFSVLHDLTEPLEIAALLVGLLLYWDGHLLKAGLAWSLAALTRETALIFIIAVALAGLRDRSSLRGARADIAWLLPVVTWASWQGRVQPVGASRRNLTRRPVGVVHAWAWADE